MSLVKRIQKLCSSKNTTLIGLEREIGLGRGTIRNWDNNSPSVDKVQKVARHFNVSVDYLLGNTNDPNEYFIPYNELPEVLKPFHTLESELRIIIEGEDTNIPEKRTEAIGKTLKELNALDHPEFNQIIDLLPEDKKGEPISLYDLFYIVGNDPIAMNKLIANKTIGSASVYPDFAKIANPDIREIARAGKNMSSDEAAELRKFAERLFPNAFKKDSR